MSNAGGAISPGRFSKRPLALDEHGILGVHGLWHVDRPTVVKTAGVTSRFPHSTSSNVEKAVGGGTHGASNEYRE